MKGIQYSLLFTLIITLVACGAGGGSIWHDADAGTVGLNPVLKRTDFDQNGFILNSVRNTHIVDTGSGILGLTYKYFRNTEYTAANVPAMYAAEAVVTTSGYKSLGFAATSPEALTANDIYVDDAKNASNHNLSDDTWKGATRTDIELFYQSGTVYIYNTNKNAPTNDTHYISVATSTDMRNFTLPTNYILKDYMHPNVFKYENKIYMVAFSTTEEKWHLIPGSSPTSFDASQAKSFDIGVTMFSAGGWDDTPSFTSLPNDQPEVAGVEFLDGKVYLFYMAGQFDKVRAPANGVSGAPYDSARGIGAFELKIN